MYTPGFGEVCGCFFGFLYTQHEYPGARSLLPVLGGVSRSSSLEIVVGTMQVPGYRSIRIVQPPHWHTIAPIS